MKRHIDLTERRGRGLACSLAAFLLTLVMIGLSGTTSAAASAAPAADSPITGIYVLYSTEEVKVVSSAPVYYAILKKATDTTVKVADLLPASQDVGITTNYYIDVSALSSAKTNYIGIADTNVADAAGLVHVVNLAVEASQKKAVFNVNFGIEGTSNYGARILESVVVTNNDNTLTTYRNNPGTNEKAISELDVEWRKGMNCPWKKLSAMTKSCWESMKTSGAVIYFRIAAKDDVPGTDGQRYSKEQKTKLTVTKAPSVKPDVSKLTLSIKNGMQFRIVGSNRWSTVLPCVAKNTNLTSIRTSTNPNDYFNPYTEACGVKVNYLSIDQIYSAISVVRTIGTGTPLQLEVRIAATTKKPASRTAVVTVPIQGNAPAVQISTSNGAYSIDTLTPGAGDTVTSMYEYFFCKQVDYQAGAIDFATIKWQSVNKGSQLKGTLKSTYTTKLGARTAVNLSDPGLVMLIRRKGQTASTKTPMALASKETAVVLPAISMRAASPTPVPAPSAAPEPSGRPETPTGSPEPSGIPTP